MLSTLVEEKVAKIYKATFLQKLMQLLLAKNNKPYVLRCTNVKNIESEVLILHPDVLGCCKHRNNNPPAFLNSKRKNVIMLDNIFLRYAQTCRKLNKNSAFT